MLHCEARRHKRAPQSTARHRHPLNPEQSQGDGYGLRATPQTKLHQRKELPSYRLLAESSPPNNSLTVDGATMNRMDPLALGICSNILRGAKLIGHQSPNQSTTHLPDIEFENH